MPPEEPKVPTPQYAIRLSERAIRDRVDAVAWFAVNVGDEYARQWFDGLNASLSSLASQPYLNAVQPNESRLLRRDVRREFFRKTSGSATYLLFYEVREANATGGEGPMVMIVHIRHSARRPLTAEEARNLRSNL